MKTTATIEQLKQALNLVNEKFDYQLQTSIHWSKFLVSV